MRTVLLALVGVFALFALGACGDSSTQSAGGAPTEPGDAATTGPPDQPDDGKKDEPESKDTLEPPDDPAPDFEVETFDGSSFALREQRGTPVVLNFWESW